MAALNGQHGKQLNEDFMYPFQVHSTSIIFYSNDLYTLHVFFFEKHFTLSFITFIFIFFTFFIISHIISLILSFLIPIYLKCKRKCRANISSFYSTIFFLFFYPQWLSPSVKKSVIFRPIKLVLFFWESKLVYYYKNT